MLTDYLTGLRIAQVKVIFRLPGYYGLQVNYPLAYVEWFTPFGAQVDQASRLHRISRSTRMHHPYAEILDVSRIVRNCHLTPKFALRRNPSWTADNVAELCQTFYVNHYIDLHLFCMFKLGRRGCTY